MQVQSLSELRAEIEGEEAKTVEPAIVADEIVEAEAEEEVAAEETPAEVEPVEDGDKPEWAKTEGQAVPVAKYVDLKHKLKAVKAESDSEIERLRQENEALRSGGGHKQPAQPQIKAPSLSDCGYDEEIFAQRNAEYIEALMESKLSSHAQKSQSQQQAQAAAAGLKQEVDKHYERASEFVAKGVVSEDNFRNADAVVRQAIQRAYPNGNGDAITDELIANIGEGSEKVLYHLGANPQALAKLESLLAVNPSGLKASAYLGELKAKFNAAPITKLSNAPKPDASLKGNAATATKSKKADFDKALASGDVSAALAIKRAAKGAGADISSW